MLKRQISLILFLLIFGLTACITPPPPTPDVEVEQVMDPLAQGKLIYDESCASCHGLKGEGQPNWRVPNDKGVYPAPPHDNSGHTWHHPDAQLLQIIAEGGSSPTSGMTGFADKLTEEEMKRSLDYIKTFWGEEERAIQEERSLQSGG